LGRYGLRDGQQRQNQLPHRRAVPRPLPLGGHQFRSGFTDVKWADRMMVGAVVSGMDKQAQHGATMETVYGQRFAEQTTLLANMVYQKNGFLVDGLDVSLTASHANLNRQLVDTSAYIYNWKGELNDFNGDGKYDNGPVGPRGAVQRWRRVWRTFLRPE
jgi:hypothetical protein